MKQPNLSQLHLAFVAPNYNEADIGDLPLAEVPATAQVAGLDSNSPVWRDAKRGCKLGYGSDQHVIERRLVDGRDTAHGRRHPLIGLPEDVPDVVVDRRWKLHGVQVWLERHNPDYVFPRATPLLD